MADERRQLVFGVSRQSWHMLPELERLLEENKLATGDDTAGMLNEPEIRISFDGGESRSQVDRAQTSGSKLAAEFVTSFGLEDNPEDLFSK